jgi:hypothetical protein
VKEIEDNSAITVKSHFEGKDEIVRETYEQLLRTLRNRGPVTEDPRKTSIHLVHASTLAGVMPRNNYLILTIKSDRTIESPRIRKTAKVSPKTFHLKLKLTSPADVNEELVNWLNNAYVLSA